MRSVRTLIFATLLVLVATSLASAQRSVRFDTYKHLKGFEEADLGEYSILFETPRFKELEGQRIARAKLEEIRKEWTAHRAEIQAKIKAIKADPKRQGLFEVQKAIHRDEYLRQVDYRIVERLPFFFVIQRPNKDSDDYYTKLADGYAEKLGALDTEFRKVYAEPLGLKLREKFGYHAIAILSSRGAYSDYMSAKGVEDVSSRAHYQFVDRLAVTWEASYQQGRRFLDEEKDAAILHEFVHQLQHAWHSGEGRMPEVFWYTEGLAEYLSVSRPVDFKNSDFLRLRASILERQLWTATTSRLTQPLEDLIEIADRRQLLLRNVKRAGPAGLSPQAMGLFYRQSFMFIQFLEEGDGGRWQSSFRTYLKNVQNGITGREAWNAAFGSTKPGDLEKKFLAHLAAITGNKNIKDSRLGDGEIVGHVNPQEAFEGPERSAPGLRAKRPRPKRGLTAPKPFDHTALVAPEAIRSLRLSAALGNAARGDLSNALKTLESARDPRVLREKRRLQALLARREEFAKRGQQEGWRVRVDSGGKRVSRKIIGVDDSGLVLDKDAALDWDDLGPEGLRRELRKRKLVTDEYGWMEDYLRLLAGKKAKSIDAGGQNLAGDAESIRTALATSGNSRDVLVAFDPAPVASPTNARARLAALKRLRATQAKVLPAVSQQEGFARFLLETAFAPESLVSSLNGEVKKLEGRRFSVHYDFSDRSQVKDFTTIDYLKMVEPEKKLASEIMGEEPFCGLKMSALVQKGAVTTAWKLPLTGKVRVTAKVRLRGNAGSGTLFAPSLGAVIADRGDESFVMASALGYLLNYRRGVLVEGEKLETDLTIDKEFTIDLLCDAMGSVAVNIDGLRVALSTRTKSDGRVLLRSHSEYELHWMDLVIEGKLDEKDLGQARTLSVARGLTELGF